MRTKYAVQIYQSTDLKEVLKLHFEIIKKMAVHTENQFEIKWGKVLFQLFTRNVQCIL